MSVTAEASLESAVATAVLRKSLQTRCEQAGVALGAMVIMAILFGFLLGQGINIRIFSLFLGASSGLLLIRYMVAKRMRPVLDSAVDADLQRFDWRFRWISLLSQTTIGAAIWIMWGGSGEGPAYVMTLLICLYGLCAMTGLAQDYRSFVLTMPAMMAHLMLFWLLRDSGNGLAIAMSLGAVTLLMITSVRNSQRTFEESVRIRFEKDELLREVERERETALRAAREAEAANRSKSFFMAAASHDLRQPLYAATILADTLALHPLQPDAMRLLEQQRTALSAASVLFDNLLDLSRFESRTIEPTLTVVSLKELLRNIESEFSALSTLNGLSFVVEPTEHHVRSDYDLLDRMVRNLISNALRYTHRGGVRVECQEDGATIILTIADTGIGIAPEDQLRIFNEFVQLHNPQRARDRGVGLGLAIVRHIAALLDHPVDVKSQIGQGTRMSIRLPCVEPMLATGREYSVAERHVQLHGRRVWIVEDDLNVRSALEAYFTACGCWCAATRSRAEVATLLRDAHSPDYVLVDDMLGEHETGLELAHWLAQRIEPMRILLMTGNADVKRLNELSTSRFAMLRKPISVAALNDWVSRVNSLGGDRISDVAV